SSDLIRLLNPTFGETIVVTGLGLIGLMAAQLLRANGCQVIGLDFESAKVALAKQWGIQAFDVSGGSNPAGIVENLTGGVGADGVLITASTKGNEVIAQAAHMSRKRGRIVLVGVIGLDIQRSDFYEKELTFQVSCSYGPGRYDGNYENKGQDYPLPYVRWTEKRNFEAVLKAIANGSLDVKPLISEVVDVNDYENIYKHLGQSKSIASILRYSAAADVNGHTVPVKPRNFKGQKGVLGIIGAGNFTKAVIGPELKKLGANVKYIASARGLSATTSARKFGIAFSTTDTKVIFEDPEVDAVLITTRHDLHARQVVEALDAGKHVFVEKPLALTLEELEQVGLAYQRNNKTLTVGFNRRFSPFLTDARNQLGETGAPINVIASMNAGFIPSDSWVHDVETGGGRIIGEACHLIDLISFLAGSLVESVVMNALGPNPAENTDNASILLRYKNGSQGVIQYFSNGSKAYSKERIEVYSQNRTMVIDNFKKSKYYGFKKSGLSHSQDKGHREQFRLFMERLKNGGPATIPFEEIMNTSRAAICAVQSLKEGKWVDIHH
ncbi:MAG: dehydrogenase, partial [Saprospiraceae bacterium]